MSKTTKNLTSTLQLIVETELEDLFAASKNLNPFLTYVRFILTDSEPNANGDIVPVEEFANLVRTGLYMPLKMALGEIKDGHEASTPLGVITHLRIEDNVVRGVAALWNRERPADISFIKERYANGEPLDLSWELGFDPEASEITDDGYRVLRGCVLRATTLVGIPAYEGRTNITDIDMASNMSKEDETVKELEQLKEQVETLEAEVQTLKEEKEALSENQMTDEVKEELAELRSFKQEIEAEAARLETLAEIRNAFGEAGLDKDEEFFNANEDKLIALKDSDMLDFFIESLASKEEKEEEELDEEDLEEDEDSEEEEASTDEDELEEDEASAFPNIKNLKLGDGEYSTREIAKALREKREKQFKLSKETK